jgi:Polysaccharide lyase
MTFSASQWKPTTYDSDTFKLDSYDFMVSSEYTHSFAYNPTADVYRFEVRDGDHFSSSRFTDVAGSERSEISQSLRQSISGAANYASSKWSFMIEPGQANTAKWMSLGQFHSGMNKSGPFDFGLRGDDKLSFVIRSGAGEKEIELPANVQRGKWYDIKVDLHFGPGGGGYVKVWLDGQQVVNHSGAVGYTDQSTTHWNMGVYRSSPAGNETIAYNVKGFDLAYGSSAAAASHGAPTGSGASTPIPAPTPAPTPEPTPAPTEPSTISTINGTSGNDIFTGTSVAEKIVGKGGMDLLTGGTGSDTFAFDTALGTSNVVTITDFTPGIDKIEFSSKVFTSLWVQELGTDVFRVGTAADHNDHILYNQATGALYYDADGNGSGAAVQFAKVAAGLALSASDFYTI